MANKLKQLDALSKAVPGLNRQAQRQSKAAQDIMLQAQVKQAKPQAGVAQQMAMQHAGASGAATQQRMAKQQNAAAQLGQTAIHARGAASDEKLGRRALKQQEALHSAQELQNLKITQQQLESKKRITQEDITIAKNLQLYGIERDNELKIATMRQTEDLAKLGNDIKYELLDSRLNFNRTEAGRKFTNARQLADVAAVTAKNEIELNQKLNSMKLQADRSAKLMDRVRAKITQELSQEYRKGKSDRDHQRILELAEAKAAAERAAARKKARAQGLSNALGGIGMVVGGIVGGIYGGGPAGAAAGASVGGAVGQGVGTAVSQ